MNTPLLPAGTDKATHALLVDRDADTRKMYSEYLALSAWTIDEAEDGREALAKALARHHDIIITETRLPGINGFDLCALLRTDVSTRAALIVLVTGDAYESDVIRAKAAGADSVLVKPCLPETLLSEVQRLVDNSRNLRDSSEEVRERLAGQIEKSDRLIDRSREVHRRTMLSRAYDRHDTIDPPSPPPTLVCPSCDQPLRYERSHIGGVSARHSEQWDYFECPAGCGAFQYRQRTRKLRKI
jgi:DNA-binding response OmpR family regulator